MKFDYVIGNPPYQESYEGESTGSISVYDKFMEASYSVADNVELITPARFLFDAGATPKQWNQKMLNDKHFKVLRYESDARFLFSNVDIKGGVAITYRSKDKQYEPIRIFTPYNELNSILSKVLSSADAFLSDIAVSSFSYHFTEKMHEDYPEAKNKMSKGHAYDLKSSSFEKISFVFQAEKPDDGKDYAAILGRANNERKVLFIDRDYITNVLNLDSYKLFISKANGTGSFGEVLAEPIIGMPGMGATETFLSIGNFSSEVEAINLKKYLACKFPRALLGVLKVTQDVTPQKWKYVPLQDFTETSDIDWTRSISGIDQQLYKKYSLTQEEVDFIETHVKEMN